MAYLPRPVWQAIRLSYRFYSLLRRPMSLGVRGLVRDAEGRVLLIRHTYVDGWYLPGGGVERSETIWTSIKRELSEEAGVTLQAPPRFIALFANFREFKSDHVALFYIEPGSYTYAPRPNFEIAEIAFFPVTDLPEDTTRGTRERIAEFMSSLPAPENW